MVGGDQEGGELEAGSAWARPVSATQIFKRSSMKSKQFIARKKRPREHSQRQGKLLLSSDGVTANTSAESPECHIVSVGKRRDGGTRYWCLQHKADATAKYGKRARTCRAAHVRPGG